MPRTSQKALLELLQREVERAVTTFVDEGGRAYTIDLTLTFSWPEEGQKSFSVLLSKNKRENWTVEERETTP